MPKLSISCDIKTSTPLTWNIFGVEYFDGDERVKQFLIVRSRLDAFLTLDRLDTQEADALLHPVLLALPRINNNNNNNNAMTMFMVT